MIDPPETSEADRDRRIESIDTRDWEKNIIFFADNHYDVIITVGTNIGEAMVAVATEYPNISFIGVDQEFDEEYENIATIGFPEDKAGFLAGMLAAMVSSSGKIGGICETSGIDTVWQYCEGFRAGAYCDAAAGLPLDHRPQLGKRRRQLAVRGAALADDRREQLLGQRAAGAGVGEGDRVARWRGRHLRPGRPEPHCLVAQQAIAPRPRRRGRAPPGAGTQCPCPSREPRAPEDDDRRRRTRARDRPAADAAPAPLRRHPPPGRAKSGR